MEILFVLLLALAVDLALGEPPAAVHPVVWMGKVASFLTRGGGRWSSRSQFLYGLAVTLVTVGIFVAPVYFALYYLKDYSLVAYVIVAALIFKTSFSLKGLRRAALKIRNLLAEDKLAQARLELRSLVGRDTGKLDKGLMVSATVESVAENICDSFIAPLFFFLFLGVPGAVAYRAINTLDAMIGHHGEFEHLGKFAARLDDVANFIPARITALLIVLSAWISRKNASAAWQAMIHHRRMTESPNAGWTMSAAAGALGVQLEKIGYYKLGDNRNPLLTATIDASLKIAMTAAIIWSLMLGLIEVIYHVTA
jgi:adenosylcobinamide-phosphate synthase